MKLLDTAMAVFVSLSGMNAVPPKDATQIDRLNTQLRLDPQTFCMAQNIYFESRNESTAGMVAVANVTLNRAKHKRFPDTVCEVVYEGPHYYSEVSNTWFTNRNRCQFSWYCDGEPDVIATKKKFWEIYALSEIIMRKNKNNELIDMTDGALFYHADYVSPAWSFKMKKKVVIDRHIFYRP